LSGRVAAALSPEWASFPTESGRSYYGQPVKSLDALQKYYGSVAVGSQPAPQQIAAVPSTSSAGPQISTEALTTALRKKKATSLLDTVKSGLMQQLIQQTLSPPNNIFGLTGLMNPGGMF
jgi:hypothetical protein